MGEELVATETALQLEKFVCPLAEQECNLSVSIYVEQEDTREKIDIFQLNEEISQIVARSQILRLEIDKIIAEIKV